MNIGMKAAASKDPIVNASYELAELLVTVEVTESSIRGLQKIVDQAYPKIAKLRETLKELLGETL